MRALTPHPASNFGVITWFSVCSPERAANRGALTPAIALGGAHGAPMLAHRPPKLQIRSRKQKRSWLVPRSAPRPPEHARPNCAARPKPVGANSPKRPTTVTCGRGRSRLASRSRRRWPWWLRRPTRNGVSVSTAIVLITASLAASGYFVWQHRNLVERQQHAAGSLSQPPARKWQR